jgi:hypothetical protein
MTMTRTGLIERSWLRNQSRGVQTPYARYDSLVSQAMANLARRVAESGSDLLKTDFLFNRCVRCSLALDNSFNRERADAAGLSD